MPHQLSVFAENKPGKIERITAILAEGLIDIRAITIADSGDYGIIKLLVDKPVLARDLLQHDGIAVSLKEIAAVEMEDEPGALHKVALVLKKGDVNVEDAYGFTSRHNKKAVFVFQTDQYKEAVRLLQTEGYTVLNDQDLYLI